MGIADIFEALTARDRPYKEGMKLSQTLAIMERFRAGGHIDPDLFDVWHSSKTGPKELNFVGFKNQEVDRLIVEGRGTFAQEERRRCYFRIQEILADEQPYTFLYVPDALPVVQARFRGIEPAPAGISHNFIRWYVPKEEQLTDR